MNTQEQFVSLDHLEPLEHLEHLEHLEPLESPVPADLVAYVETSIVPRYAAFDAAHREDHARMVIEQSMQIVDTLLSHKPPLRAGQAEGEAVSRAMAYAIAAFHDLGLCEGRDTHHIVSARIIRADAHLRRWFTEDEVSIMADAAEDHRASAKSEPRTIYGRIVAEADRFINPRVIIRRTLQYGFEHYPTLSRDEHLARAAEHLHEKYGDGGYLRLWIPGSPNAQRLEALRQIIRDEERLRCVLDEVWDAIS